MHCALVALGGSGNAELTGPAAIRLEGLRVVLQHFQHGDMKPPAVSGLISHRAKAMPCSIGGGRARISLDRRKSTASSLKGMNQPSPLTVWKYMIPPYTCSVRSHTNLVDTASDRSAGAGTA